MRYVDRHKLQLPVGWPDRAECATRAVAYGADPKAHSNVWRELKDKLAVLNHQKCWYCEVPVDRSDNAVDHFRPKGRVSDAAREHLGYRWLAFDTVNLRYACTFCNSRRKGVDGQTAGGKGDRFPLLDESKRVYNKGPIDGEEPVLLDPCTYSDCMLLGCRMEDGRPCAAPADPIGKRRAEESIEIYHLHHEPTCKRRHAEAVKLLADLDEGKQKFALAAGSSERQNDFQGVAQRILRSIDPMASFSGDMRFLVRGERSEEHPWIQELLES